MLICQQLTPGRDEATEAATEERHEGGPEPQLPEPSEKLIRKLLDRSVSFLFYSSTKTNPTVSCYLVHFCELEEVCSEVPEDSRVLRARRLWLPTSDCLQTWLIPSGTTRSRQYQESTIV